LFRDQTVSVFVIAAGGVKHVPLPISAPELQKEIDLTRYGLSSVSNPRRESALRWHLQRPV
jgi:Ni,Fe-hydrogenase III small subunit